MKHRLFSKSRGAFSIITSLVLTTVAHAASGDPDTTFGTNGIIRISFGGGNDFGRALAVQADGKVVVAGYSGTFPWDISLVRYNTNDTVDTSFGIGGKVLTHTGALTNSQAHAVRLQADGKIVVAGFAYSGNYDFAVARYNTDGSLDGSFNTNGFVITDLGGSDTTEALLVQPDGKILVAGMVQSGPGTSGIVRYNTNGTLDTTWNGTGKVTTSVHSEPHGLLYLSDGKILVAGRVRGHLGLARYNTNGTLDATFGAGGVTNVVAGTSSAANAIGIQPGNFTPQQPDKILLAGYAEVGGNVDFALARFFLDGARDTTFDTDGVVTTPIGANSDRAQAMIVTGNFLSRRITLAGYSYDGTNHRIALVRYDTAGVPESAFGGNGKVTTAIGPGPDEAHSIAFQAGRILVAGSSFVNADNNDFALVRYNSDGSLDSSYDGDGIKLEDVADNESTAQSVVIQPDGKMVVAGYAKNGAGYVFALARLNTDGSLDSSFGIDGKVKSLVGANSSTANAAALQPDGKILVGGSCAEGSALARYHTNGALDDSFNGDGKVIAPNGQISGLALQPDGRIVGAGGVSDDFLALRFQTNGTPDASFDGDGRVTTAIGTGTDTALQVKVQPDGKIVVAGHAEVNMHRAFALVRYNTNGSLDNSFGSFGRVATVFGGNLDVGIGMALQTNGRIVVAGYTVNPVTMNADVAVARYLTNGMLDGSFDGDGKVTTAIGFANDLGTSVALQPDGKIVVGGIATIGADAGFAVLRYNPDGSLDDSYGLGGKAVVNVGNENLLSLVALALDSKGRAVLAGDIRGLFGVVRLLGDPEIRIVSIERLGGGHVLLMGTGLPNANHTILGSGTVNPRSFTPVGNASADSDGLWQYEDATAVGVTQRFYRASFP